MDRNGRQCRELSSNRVKSDEHQLGERSTRVELVANGLGVLLECWCRGAVVLRVLCRAHGVNDQQ